MRTKCFQPGSPLSVPLAWFVLLSVGSGGVFVMATSAGLDGRTWASLARLAVIAWAVVIVSLRGIRPSTGVPRQLRLAVLVFISGAAAVLAAGVLREADPSEVLAGFGFMYGPSLALGICLVAPVSASFGRLTALFLAASVAFGLAQWIAQDYLLPVEFTDRYGIVGYLFVNEQLRIPSFFASHARFAEVCVVAALVLQHRMLLRRAQWPLLLGAYALVVWALLNTFSRSGYVLYLASSASLILLMLRSSPNWRVRSLAVASAVGAMLLALLMTLGVSLPVDDALTSTTTLEIRQEQWDLLLADVAEFDFWSVSFGSGRTARFSQSDPNYFIVDNLYLGIYLYGGVVALASCAYLYRTAIRHGLRIARNGGTSIEPVLALSIGLLFAGFTLDNHNALFLTLTAMIGLIGDRRTLGTDPGHVVSASAPDT